MSNSTNIQSLFDQMSPEQRSKIIGVLGFAGGVLAFSVITLVGLIAATYLAL